jgi:hypothetical protein
MGLSERKDMMDTDANIARVTRVASHEVTWGKLGIVTKVTVEFGGGDEDGNEDRHVPAAELTVEYSGHPRHKVGDRFPALADSLLKIMGLA